MTVNEIKAEFNKRAAFADSMISTELGDYWRDTLVTIISLHRNGYTRDFNNDFLRLANGYKINTQDSNFTIKQTLDLRCIEADKKSTRAFAEYLLTA